MKLTKVVVSSVAAVFLAACAGDGVRHTPDAAPTSDGAVDAPPDAPLNPAMLSGSPGATDFGDVVIGQTTSKATYTISNDGDEASGTVSVIVDPQTAGFALSDNTCSGVSLAMHETCTFAVAFTPATAGTAMATVHIAATPGGEITRDLTGDGLQPGALDIIEASHDFTKLAGDATPTTHTFTVKNTGQVPTGVPTPSITGTAATYSIQSTTCTAPLAAAATCSVVVKFDPATVGSKPATLVVTGSPGGSDSATLSGIGVAHVAITKIGNGTGMVTSNMTGINCGSACTADFSATPVTLTAVPDTGVNFMGWTGDCNGTMPCTLDLTAGKSAAANFTKQRFTLTTSTTGNGKGTVVLNPAPVGGAYDYGQVVTVTASADISSTFDQFGGDCSNNTCTVTMTANHAVSADFTKRTFTLTTSTTGTGKGTITGGGTYYYGDPVTVTATPDISSTFAKFGGDCSATTCSLTMYANHTVSAEFDTRTFTLTTSTTGIGKGTVTVSPAPVAGTYDYGQTVTVTATADISSNFTGFTGDCSTNPCSLTMTANHAVSANFDKKTFTLTTSTTGTGKGTITGAGTYYYGDPVTITASADISSSFTGFGGDCSASTTNTCSLTMYANHSVSANFDIRTFTLTTATTGDGQGTVTLSPAPVGGTYNYGQTVTVTASPAISSNFTGITGDCTTNPCTLTMYANHAVSANFDKKTFTLTTSTTGAGSGTVSGAGTYKYGDPVTVTASPASGSRFASWGGDCAGMPTCSLTMYANHAVSAEFEPTVFAFTVDAITNDAQYNSIYVTYPTATGSTADCISSPSGVSCGATLGEGTVVNLVAHLPPVEYPAWHTKPIWYGCDSVSSDDLTCTITLSYTRSVSVYGDTLALIGRTR